MKYSTSDKGKATRKAYRKTDTYKDVQKRYVTKDYKENPWKYKHRYLWNRYGITGDEYVTMKESQNFACAICGTPEETLVRQLAVDHCHKTNKVRGLLCKACNTGIGNFKDNQELLLKAIAYLKDHST